MKTCICDKCSTEIEMNVQEEVIDQIRTGRTSRNSSLSARSAANATLYSFLISSCSRK